MTTDIEMNETELYLVTVLYKLGWNIQDYRHIGYGIPDFKVTAPNGFINWVECKGKGKVSNIQRRIFNSGIFGKVLVARTGNMANIIGLLILSAQAYKTLGQNNPQVLQVNDDSIYITK